MTVEPPEPRKLVFLEKIYLKNLEYRSPKTPEVFITSINPEKSLNIHSMNTEIDQEQIEVALTVAVKAVAEQETVFHVKVVHAGLFKISGYSPAERVEILGRVCPEMLFPFARNMIFAMAKKGGFPDVLINPLDFDALFAQNMRERAGQAAAT